MTSKRGGVNRAVRALLAGAGYEVRRLHGRAQRISVPPLSDDPFDALLLAQGGQRAAFLCPVHKWVHYEGFGLSSGAWQPFRETLRAYASGHHGNYGGSVLEAFHRAWQPKSAAEALAGFTQSPAVFAALPPSGLFHFPWSAHSAQQTCENVSNWHLRDWKEHGVAHLNPDEDGIKDFGPVSARNGSFEMRRLIGIYEGLREAGFERERGDIPVTMVKRGNDYRIVPRGGYHRAVAMSVLGNDVIPAQHLFPWMVNVDDAMHWPQVRAAVWTEEQARAYVDHLFDFDSYQWALDMGLVAQAR